jgi:hypothetical protein
MDKIDLLIFEKNLRTIQFMHSQRMILIASMGWLYTYLRTTTKDEDLNEAIKSLEKDLKKIGMSVDNYLFGSLLITLIAEIELFLTDTLYCIFKAFPKKIKNMKLDFNDIVDKSSDEIIQIASEKYVNELMYKKPLDYLESFCQVASIDSGLVMKYWPSFIEAKARRDLGIHNNWVANETYIKKIKEVNLNPEFSLGESVYPDNNYLGQVHDNCVVLTDTINNALDDKFGFESITSASTRTGR